MDYVIVPATEEHVRAIAPLVRAADRAEVEALVGDLLEGLMNSFRASLWTRVALVGGKPVCIWGLGAVSLLCGVGGPWMIGTRSLARMPRELLRESRAQMEDMLTMFPVLCGVVDARYTGAVRWIRWLGFEVSEPFQVNGVPFRQYRKMR